jgi:hypothetical protein
MREKAETEITKSVLILMYLQQLTVFSYFSSFAVRPILRQKETPEMGYFS